MIFDAGTTNIPAAGTATQLNNTERKVRVIEVRSRPSNVGNIYFGVSDVSKTNGRTLQPEETVTVNFGDGSEPFSNFYVDADTSGDNADWSVIIR